MRAIAPGAGEAFADARGFVDREGAFATFANPAPGGNARSKESAAIAAEIGLVVRIGIFVIWAGFSPPNRFPLDTPNSRLRFNFQQLEEADRRRYQTPPAPATGLW